MSSSQGLHLLHRNCVPTHGTTHVERVGRHNPHKVMETGIAESIRHQSKIALTLMVRDLILSLMPIVILVGLHNVW